MRKEKVRVGKRKIDKDLHDLLMRHYDLDDEKGICRLRFEYERFDDFFETRCGKGAILKGALKDTLENLLVTIPNCYDFEFTIAIKDYQGHSKEEGMRALKDGLLLNGYTYRRAMTVKKWIALALLLSGIAILVVMALLQAFAFDGEQNAIENIVTEILDIAAWVFVWESVTIYFLERSAGKIQWEKSQDRIKAIRFETIEVGKTEKGEEASS